MSAASENLKTNQRQLDMDGCEVGVSRQAVEETLGQFGEMLAALKAVEEWWLNDAMKNFTGAPYAIFATRAAIAKTENRP